MAKDKTTINVPNVPDELKRQAKIKALDEGRPLAAIVRDLIKKWVDQPEKKGTQNGE